jgi:ATP-binding cassette subfamily F protein uup
VLLVSHDRAFLNDVVTSTLALEPDGRVKESDGGYDDYLRQRPDPAPDEPKPTLSPAKTSSPTPERPRRLSFKERRELDELPQRIEALEAALQELHEAMADPAFYCRDGGEIAQAKARLASLEKELTQTYERWETLEGLAG